jgi:predicted nuclease of predicted toxin-antitoxin system
MPRDTRPRLIEIGADVEDARDIAMGQEPDDVLFNYAQREQRIVVTRDRDFAELAMKRSDHAGVVLVRSLGLRSPHITTTLIERLEALEGHSPAGSIVVIELGRTRIRRVR